MPPHPAPHGSGSTTPLGDYVKAHLQIEGISARELVRRSRDPEGAGRLQPQWMNDMIRGDVPPPQLWRLRALAAGMSSNEQRIRDEERYAMHLHEIKKRAAAQWYELQEVMEISTPSGATVTVSVPGHLSEEERQKVIDAAELLAKGIGAEE